MAEAPVEPAEPAENEYRGLPEYSDGTYFDLDPGRHGEDAVFKAKEALALVLPIAKKRGWTIESYADVGCGAGQAAHAVARGLREGGHSTGQAWGIDVYPEVGRLTSNDGIQFVHGDFTASGPKVDLVTLFDVFEHVPDPVGFVRSVADRCKYIAFHIPLDNSFDSGLRDRFAGRLHSPGHLIALDPAQALAIPTYAGLRVVDYAYTPAFRAPSGGESLLARVARIPRAALFRLSPWLLAKTVGGCSLMVVAETPRAWETRDANLHS